MILGSKEKTILVLGCKEKTILEESRKWFFFQIGYYGCPMETEVVTDLFTTADIVISWILDINTFVLKPSDEIYSAIQLITRDLFKHLFEHYEMLYEYQERKRRRAIFTSDSNEFKHSFRTGNVEKLSEIIKKYTLPIVKIMAPISDIMEGAGLISFKYLIKTHVISIEEGYLETAVMHQRIDIVEFLIEQGADIEYKWEGGMNPLLYASNKGFINLVKYLVEKGANIEAKDHNGETSLFGASYNSYLEIVEFLIEQGADIEVKNVFGYTVLERVFKDVKSDLSCVDNNDKLDIVDYLLGKRM